MLGKHSGRHALKKRTEDLGYDLSKDELQSLYERFTAMADDKKGVLDEETLQADGLTSGGHGATIQPAVPVSRELENICACGAFVCCF